MNRGVKAVAQIAAAIGTVVRIGIATAARVRHDLRSREIAKGRARVPTAVAVDRRNATGIETADRPNRPHRPSCPSR
ncbi:MAG TPA: hypothetical protein VMV72_15040 [Verrucomicrobiae bacterium]|nr:hypothetical protein [Verrucomicrobiae bacterium]